MPSLLAFIDPRQQGMVGALSEAVIHPAAALLQTYLETGIPVHTGPPWSRQALEHTIANRPHVWACSTDMIMFIHGEMQHRVQDGFSILLSAEDAVQRFREKLKIFHIAAVPQP